MGGRNAKEAFVQTIQELSTLQNVANQEESFWNRYWDHTNLTYYDYFQLLKADDIRKIRDSAAGNLTALCFKLVERISKATTTACSGPGEHHIVLNCVRLLTRVIPFLLEDSNWRMIFWAPANMTLATTGPGEGGGSASSSPSLSLGQMLLNSVGDLLFCPDFTVMGKKKKNQPEKQEDLSHVDSCEHLWEAGIACTKSSGSTNALDTHRTELLSLLIVCFSESLYYSQEEEKSDNQWLAHFTSIGNRHILPLLTSLLNVVFSYDPVGYGVPYAYAFYSDARENLVTAALQLLVIVLDYKPEPSVDQAEQQSRPVIWTNSLLQETAMKNLFYSYVARLHQKDDLEFIVSGMANLLNNPLTRTYLPSSRKKIFFVEELLVLGWKMMEANKKFLNHILQSSKLFDIVVPVLFYILDAKASASKVGQLHVGIFIILLMSGERNFGVRLNKPFNQKVHPDLPHFTGTHTDLLYLTVHRVITSGLPRLQPLYDSLLTILVNVSPYLKTLCMVTCTRLLHLMESFATPWFLCAKPTNHYLIFYLLESFNNIIQYQFDGNTNLVYCLIRSRAVFHRLSNLSIEDCRIGERTPKSDPKSSTEEPLDTAEDKKEDSPEQQASAYTQRVEVEVHPQPQTTDPDAASSEFQLPKPSDEPSATEVASQEVLPDANGSVTPKKENGSGEEDDIGPQLKTIPDITPPRVPLETIDIRTSADPQSGDPQSPSLDHQKKREEWPSYPADPLSKLDKGKKGGYLDLLPLGQGVASNTVKLIEPHPPSDFQPTAEWLKHWKEKLPVQTILRLLQVLVPQVEKLCVENNVTTEREVLDYLKNGTLVGLLPIPHPILIRKYQTNVTTLKWFHTYIWGLLFVKNYDIGLWTQTEIKLFQLVTV